jgi:hypothetical protein
VLNSISPVLAAVLGGFVVSLIVQQVQDRRAESKREEELRQADIKRRTQLALDIMRTSFSFYVMLIEATRVSSRSSFAFIYPPVKRAGYGTAQLTC